MAAPQVIVQFAFRGPEDFDRLVHVEETLIQAFAQRNPFAEVDGHDVGQGHSNIFVRPTGAWTPVLERIEASLKLRGVWKEALVAKRLKSEKYIVVWPKEYDGAFEL